MKIMGLHLIQGANDTKLRIEQRWQRPKIEIGANSVVPYPAPPTPHHTFPELAPHSTWIKAPVLSRTKMALHELPPHPSPISPPTSPSLTSDFLIVYASGPLHLLLFLPGQFSSTCMTSCHPFYSLIKCHFYREDTLDHKTLNINSLQPLYFSSLFDVFSHYNHRNYILLCPSVPHLSSPSKCELWRTEFCHWALLSSPQHPWQCPPHSSRAIYTYLLTDFVATNFYMSTWQLHQIHCLIF